MSRHFNTIALADNVAKDAFAEPAGGNAKRGPFSILIKQGEGSSGAVIPAFMDEGAQRTDGSFPSGSNKNSHRCTTRAAEDTAYDGDGGTTAFTGQVLNNLPVAPFSVNVNGPGGGDQVIYDKLGDGKLYIQNLLDPDSEVEGGTIDYATGALTLAYTIAPGVGDILCDYVSTAKVGINGQQHHALLFQMDPIGGNKELSVWCAGDGSGRCDVELTNHADGIALGRV